VIRSLALPALVAILGLLHAPAAQACGPYFSVPVLGGQGTDPADVPAAHFDAEVAAWARRADLPFEALLVRTIQGDRADAERLLPADQVQVWLDARAHDRPVPDSFPQELRLYHQAVLDMHAGRLDAARAGLRELLALPAPDRQYRSTWAAYVLGVLEPSAQGRVTRLRQVRELAGQGFADSLGLAAASFRREAEELPPSRPAERLQACASYVATGGRLGCATQLRSMARDVLSDPHAHRRAADLPAAAAIVTLELTSRGAWGLHGEQASARARGWLDAMLDSPHARPLAGRLAWIAHALHQPDLARRHLSQAPQDDPLAAWIDGKIRLQAGDLDGAADALERAAARLSAHAACDHHHRDAARAAHVELGVVRVAQDQPVLAMESFLAGADWMDAAWVGERLLTTDELTRVVQRHAPRDQPFDAAQHGLSGHLPTLAGGQDLDPEIAPALLRGLLGRRLVREGRLEQARPYLPAPARPHLDQVVRDLRLGRDTTATDHARGGALWRAAFTLKMQGWALSATELEPDQRVLGGWYPGSDTGRRRAALGEGHGLAPTPDEVRRRTAHAPDDRRYHFVYTSDELARQAMALMPDDHPDLPQAACVTGHWMKHRDAQRSWDSWMVLKQRTPSHALAQALDGRSGWWRLQEDGTCALPDGTPVDADVGCDSVGVPWSWAGVFALGVPLLLRRRRARLSPR